MCTSDWTDCTVSVSSPSSGGLRYRKTGERDPVHESTCSSSKTLPKCSLLLNIFPLYSQQIKWKLKAWVISGTKNQISREKSVTRNYGLSGLYEKWQQTDLLWQREKGWRNMKCCSDSYVHVCSVCFSSCMTFCQTSRGRRTRWYFVFLWLLECCCCFACGFYLFWVWTSRQNLITMATMFSVLIDNSL